MSKNAALIVAAGSGRRFGGDVPKQYLALGGQSVLRRAISPFLRHKGVDTVRVVIHPDLRDIYEAATEGLDLLPPVHGGAKRGDSVRLGLESFKDMAPEKVLIHDGARPFVDGGVISRVLDALDENPGAVPAIPVIDTLKRCTNGVIDMTVSRDRLWRVQTPQGFRFGDIMEAHLNCRDPLMTDDAGVAEAAGLTVAIVAGNEANIKVTTEADLRRAEQFLGSGQVRTGMGFDVHRFGPGDHINLCGVRIGFDRCLIGHSDADVGLHAITDAVLGAISEGDIGTHFPPGEAKWRGVDSGVFLKKAADLVAARSGVIANVDVTLICEDPKIGPHRQDMIQKVADLLNLSANSVSVKGTTTERLGFTGRGEGIAAQAVATVYLPFSE